MINLATMDDIQHLQKQINALMGFTKVKRPKKALSRGSLASKILTRFGGKSVHTARIIELYGCHPTVASYALRRLKALGHADRLHRGYWKIKEAK